MEYCLILHLKFYVDINDKFLAIKICKGIRPQISKDIPRFDYEMLGC
jgi:hypothetical protein